MHQVLAGVTARRIQSVRQAIGQYAVDLLGHGPISRPQAGFDVCDGHPSLGGHKRASDRAVDVAEDHDPARCMTVEETLEPHHDACGLLSVRSSTDLEIDLRFRNAELLEETPGHRVVIMLAGMGNHEPGPLPRCERPIQRGELHEVGPCPSDQHEVEVHR